MERGTFPLKKFPHLLCRVAYEMRMDIETEKGGIRTGMGMIRNEKEMERGFEFKQK